MSSSHPPYALRTPLTPIPLSPLDKSLNTYSQESLLLALQTLHTDGVVVLDDVIPIEPLMRIKESMLKETQVLKEKYGASQAGVATSGSGFNHGVATNFLQSPPIMEPELFDTQVYYNPFILAVLNAYLGPQPRFGFFLGNTAMAGTSERQPVHKDCSYVHALAPHIAIVNIPLSTFSPSNGGTEVWAGSHALTTPLDQIWKEGAVVPTPNVLPALLEERRKTNPPQQISIKLGSVMIRDIRLWHAGMPNPSSEDRIMMAMGYWSRNWARFDQIKLPQSQIKNFISTPQVDCLVSFVDDEEAKENMHLFGNGFGQTGVSL